MFSAEERTTLNATLREIAARRITFIIFGLALTASALSALYAQSYFHLLRRHQLLGVEKALGATRRQLALRLIGAQLPWGLVGGLLGWAGLWSLRDILPQVFLTRPPAVVLAASLLVPLLALLGLAVAVTLPVLRHSAMALLRGRVKGIRVRRLLLLVYGGLALAVAGGLAASQVFLQVERETAALEGQFGSMYALQAGSAVIDDRLERAFEAGTEFAPVFTQKDARDLAALEGVSAATVAQSLPNLRVSRGETAAQLSAVAASDNYLEFMSLHLLEGSAEGCVLSETAARNLGVTVGQEVSLAGLAGPIPCRVSGILKTPPEIWNWLVADLPDIVTPPLDGLGLPLPGYDAQPFRSIRILVKFNPSEAEQTVRAWQKMRFPGVRAEVVPYTPDVETLLANLRVQAQVFLLITLLAAALSAWSIVGGFIALLEAERFRIALDRALGLSVRQMARLWWWRVFGLGAASAVLGVLAGYLFTVRLYNALALDIPNLPERQTLLLGPELIFMVTATLLVLSAALTLLAARWLARQSALSLLKEGAA